jgi:hypothetical protein
MDKIFRSLAFFLCCSIAFAAFNASDFSINDIKENLPEGFILPAEIEDFKLPTENVTKFLKEKCVKETGSDAAYEAASQAANKAITCITNLINFTTIYDEVEAAKPTGNVDAVFNKYCDQRGKAIQCVEDFTNSIEPCLNDEEKAQKVVFVNITKSLLEFICHENGNQIALFIAEEGPECFTDKSDEIHECVSKTFNKYNDSIPTDVNKIPNFIITEDNCRDMDKLEKCIVTELEQCKESTPANLVEALFRFVRKETPCKNFPKIRENTNTAATNKMTVEVIIGTWIMAFMAKFIISAQ